MNRHYFYIIAILILILYLTACSTLQTTNHYTRNSPKLYSGTRMNIDAITQNEDYLVKKYNIVGPENPKLDLPFSFLFDTVILPVVLPVALFEVMFD